MDLGRLIIHNFGYPDNPEILYSAKRAQISDIIFHPTDRTVLALTEIYHKPDIYVANTTVLEDMQFLVNYKPTFSGIKKGFFLNLNKDKEKKDIQKI